MTAMLTKLRDAAIYRQNLVEEAFQTEVLGMTQSLAMDQFSLYHGTKSAMLTKFDKCQKPSVCLGKNAIVIELSPLFRMKLYTWVKTFSDFAKCIYDEIMDLTETFDRCDVVAGQYFQNNLIDVM